MIELSTVVTELRRELSSAIDAAAKERLRFELGPIELEVTLALSREGGAAGKVRFWVVELGADAKAAQSATQRVKLTLQPTIADSTAPPYVAGATGERER